MQPFDPSLRDKWDDPEALGYRINDATGRYEKRMASGQWDEYDHNEAYRQYQTTTPQAEKAALQQSETQNFTPEAGFQKLTPEQTAAFVADQAATGGKAAVPGGSLGIDANRGIYHDPRTGSVYLGPLRAPQHTDNAWEQATSWFDEGLKGAFPVAFGGPALGFAGTAIAGGLAASGAVAGGGTAGLEAGAATTFAGETAASGAAGAGAATGSSVGGGSLASAAAAASAGGSAYDPGAADYSYDPGAEGTYNVPTTADTTIYPNGMDPSLIQQAKDMAAKYGITGAQALKLLQGAGGGGLMDILGRAAPGVLGAVASLKQQDEFRRLADQYASYGAPYRQRLSDLYADPSSFLKSEEVMAPVRQASDIAAHSLSVSGNPMGSPNSLQKLQDYSANQLFGRLGQEKDRLAGFGGLTAYNAAAPAAATSAINAGTNVFNSIGAGVSNIFNPPQTLAQQFAEFQRLSKTVQ